jgi:hypothetical protein
MILRFALFILLLIAANASAQQAHYSPKLKLSASHFTDTIDIEWERNQVYVPVEMNGKRYRFLFDTGAAQAVVYADTPIEGCTPAGWIRSHDAIGASDTVSMVILPALTLGNITMNGCQATVQQRPVRGRNIDGILGFNIINSGLTAKIDVRKRQLILTDNKKFYKQEEGQETRYRLQFHVPYLIISPFGRYQESVLFDTGSRQLYVMNRQSFDACAEKNGSFFDTQIEGRSVGRHAIGHFGVEPLSEVIFLHLTNLRVFDNSFSDLHTLTTLGESHIGARILEYGAVVFNPRKKCIRFQPYEQQTEITVGNKPLDIAFVAENGRPCVGLVWEQSDAYKAGVRQGDIITKIDDSIVSSFTQFVTWPFIIGREYRFTVKAPSGLTREIRWTRIKDFTQQ